MNSPVPVTGKVAGALSFNGSNSVDVPDQAELNFDSSDFSIDLWIKTTNASGARTIMDKRTGSVPNITGYVLFLSNGYLGSQIGDGAGYNNYVSTTGFVADGNWHHVAVTVDRNNTSGWLHYVDGSAVGTPANPTGYQGSLTNTTPFVMARDLITPSHTFAGTLDEVELFKRVLDSLEVRSIWAADSAGKCKPTPRPRFRGHFMTPEGEPYPFDVTISDGEWVQEFDSVTYIETEVPDSATYSMMYKWILPNGNFYTSVIRTTIAIQPGRVRSFEFFAYHPDSLFSLVRPYISYREIGAEESLSWNWNPTTNTMHFTLSGEPDKAIGMYGIFNGDEGRVPNWVVRLAGLFGIHGTVTVCHCEYAEWYPNGQKKVNKNHWHGTATFKSVISDSVLYAAIDPTEGLFGIYGVFHNSGLIENHNTRLLDVTTGDSLNPEFYYPEYAEPVGHYLLELFDLPSEFTNLDLPIFLQAGVQTASVYPPKIEALQPFTFSVIGENVFAKSSYSNLFHAEGDSITVDVSTGVPHDWWGSFTLPTNLIVDGLFAYSDTLGTEVLTELHDFIINHIEGSDLFLVVVRNAPYYDRLKLEFALRGDANGDEVIDVGDVVYVINYLFKGGPEPDPVAAGDATCDGVVDVGDVVYLINYLFKGGPPPSC
ncbi:MAG TPA: LamG-like jellyroll fold domain-containing protein [candidate division Zixibacteria bacterium]